MKIRKIMHEYYESQLKEMRVIKPIPIIQESVSIPSTSQKKFNLEEVFGYIVTTGYLIQLLLPDHWFSVGRCIFSFNIRF